MYDVAQDNSRVAYYTLVATAVVQILMLVVILSLVYRMFRGYMRASCWLLLRKRLCKIAAPRCN